MLKGYATGYRFGEDKAAMVNHSKKHTNPTPPTADRPMADKDVGIRQCLATAFGNAKQTNPVSATGMPGNTNTNGKPSQRLNISIS